CANPFPSEENQRGQQDCKPQDHAEQPVKITLNAPALALALRCSEKGAILKPRPEETEDGSENCVEDTERRRALRYRAAFNSRRSERRSFGRRAQHRNRREHCECKCLARICSLQRAFDKGEHFFMQKFAAA